MFPLRTEPLTQSFIYVATLTTEKQRKFIDKKNKMTKHLAFFVCVKSNVDSIMFQLRFISEMYA